MNNVKGRKVGKAGMIFIDMEMPQNCLDCPACNEYLMCAISVNGRKWGENDVKEYGQSRPEWCPMKEQEAVEPKTGHWIWVQYCANEGVYCSECHTKMFNYYPMKKKLSQFCGHCGAKMDDEAEGL